MRSKKPNLQKLSQTVDYSKLKKVTFGGILAVIFLLFLQYIVPKLKQRPHIVPPQPIVSIKKETEVIPLKETPKLEENLLVKKEETLTLSESDINSSLTEITKSDKSTAAGGAQVSARLFQDYIALSMKGPEGVSGEISVALSEDNKKFTLKNYNFIGMDSFGNEVKQQFANIFAESMNEIIKEKISGKQVINISLKNSAVEVVYY